eukprot:NODE_805_length_3794_cov_0.257375.p3 type:complete len:119 gc:universal NODE_805_length_3794_cov_0.257375:1759-1403(-)
MTRENQNPKDLRQYFEYLMEYEHQQQRIKQYLSKSFLLMAQYRKSNPNILPGNGNTKMILDDEYKLEFNDDFKPLHPYGPSMGKDMVNSFRNVLEEITNLANIHHKMKMIEIYSINKS